MSVSVEQAKKILSDFNSEVTEYLKTHELRELPAYEKLQKKEVIGDLYRDDQYYYETISNYKANYFGIKSFFAKVLSEKTDRTVVREVEALEKYINEKIKYLDTLVSAAKQRVKFYDSIIYLVSNMSYGDF